MINKEELINRILLLEPDFTQALLELISDYETRLSKLEKDSEKLEHIKALVSVYNNDEIHFTRGFNFIDIVKEVLDNDK